MMLPVPPLAALLDRAKPVAPVEQVGAGLGAGTGMVTPERMRFSPRLAALIAARSKALDEANPATPSVSPLEVFARGRK